MSVPESVHLRSKNDHIGVNKSKKNWMEVKIIYLSDVSAPNDLHDSPWLNEALGWDLKNKRTHPYILF